MAEVTYKKMKIKGSPIIVDAAIRDDKGRIISDKLDSIPITDLGLFSDDTQMISYILMNQLPTGLYSTGFSASGASAFLLSLLKMEDHYRAALISPETINYIHINMAGEVIESREIFHKDMISSDDLEGLTTPVVINASSSVDLLDYKDKWVKLEFTSLDTPDPIVIHNAHLPRKLEITAEISAAGITEFNLSDINVDDKLLQKSTSPLSVSGSETLNIKTGAGTSWQQLVFVLEKIAAEYDASATNLPTFREYFYYSGGDGPIE